MKAIVALIVLAARALPADAQSADFNTPTPLGPGTNKGNIDNSVSAHFYVVTIGPGRVDADFAFKEMGVFGNPFRQHLNFDVYHEDGTLSSHNAVTSQGAIAHIHTSGDLPTKRRVVLAVSTQPGAIRLGGYYEVTLTGAVTFDGPTVGTNVIPKASPALVYPIH